MNVDDIKYAQAEDTKSTYSDSDKSSDSGIITKNIPPPDTGFKENSWMKPSPRVPKRDPLDPTLLPRRLPPAQLPPLENKPKSGAGLPELAMPPGQFRRTSSLYAMPKMDSLYEKFKRAQVTNPDQQTESEEYVPKNLDNPALQP